MTLKGSYYSYIMLSIESYHSVGAYYVPETELKTLFKAITYSCTSCVLHSIIVYANHASRSCLEHNLVVGHDSPSEYCFFNPDNNLVWQALFSLPFTEEETEA